MAYNLSLWLGREHRYQDALTVAEQGHSCCLHYGRFDLFSLLLCNKGFALLLSGQPAAGKQALKQALFSQQVLGQRSWLALSQSDIIATFGEAVWNEVRPADSP